MSKLKRKPIRLGVEKLLEERVNLIRGQRVGLICNQASVNHGFSHSADLFFETPEIKLTTLFGPQHGIRGDVQDNMVETGHSKDFQTNLPIYSLYSETREPTKQMLEEVDALVFDLQDVGCRVYTFIYTMANAMKACAGLGKKFIVCDRPNPINGISFEGNLLEKGHESFVGQFPIPMRHGLTVGELARLFNREFDIGCDLDVLTMDNWSRDDFYDETDGPWVMPSPNIPTVDTAVVFPGTVYFEGTKVSEGRGTTRPFENVGAPYINSGHLSGVLNKLNLPGVIFRGVNFLPTFQKNAGNVCGGVFLHITDRNSFRPVITGLAMVKSIFENYSEEFVWKEPPYEYEFERTPFDVIDGSRKTREWVAGGDGIEDLEESWKENLKDFSEIREKYLLY
ncbi:MAG: DUF1343 domain-containing protein [Pyrinomonadaceae bacterium]